MAKPGHTASSSSRWSLSGMTALVTGGTRGIGHAVVEELCGFGARVHICSRNEAELNKCLKNWEAKGFVVTGSVCDISSREQREKLIQHVSSTFVGKLNILIHVDLHYPNSPFQDAVLGLTRHDPGHVFDPALTLGHGGRHDGGWLNAQILVVNTE